MRASDGLATPNAIKEILSDFRRPRADMWEVALWEDILTVNGRELFLCTFVDNQAIVVAETVGNVFVPMPVALTSTLLAEAMPENTYASKNGKYQNQVGVTLPKL